MSCQESVACSPARYPEIVPLFCSRFLATALYAMQAIILWIGFVWRRGVLGYAFGFFALLRCLRVIRLSNLCCSSLLAYEDYYHFDCWADWFDRLGGLSIATNVCDTRVIYNCVLGVMCVLLNVGCSRSTLKPTSLPATSYAPVSRPTSHPTKAVP